MSRSGTLIVSYTFPPSPGIGGRRWAKFAKYLHRAGEDIMVLKARARKQERSVWEKDVKEFEDRIIELPSGYPRILDRSPRSIAEKLHYRIALTALKLRTKRNYYDRSAFWQNPLLKELEKWIQKGYKNLIIAAPPYHCSHDVLRLKEKHPDLNIILDLRDFWTQNENIYGFTTLSEARLAREKKLEKESIEGADRVFVVNQVFVEYFSSLLSSDEEKEKVRLLTNGYDVEDLVHHPEETAPNDRMRGVFIGTFPRNSVLLLRELAEVLKELKEEAPEIYRAFELDIYGSVPAGIEDILDSELPVHFRGKIPIAEVQKELSKSHFGALFQTDGGKFNFITKFYEYLAKKLPILVFSNPGRTGDFVRDNGLGYACFSGDMKAPLKKAFEDWKKDAFAIRTDLDIEAFDVQCLAKDKIIPHLK
ncbi:MAG: hypothetical protein ABEH38_05930 [Flavobacteriales bacterium]